MTYIVPTDRTHICDARPYAPRRGRTPGGLCHLALDHDSEHVVRRDDGTVLVWNDGELARELDEIFILARYLPPPKIWDGTIEFCKKRRRAWKCSAVTLDQDKAQKHMVSLGGHHQIEVAVVAGTALTLEEVARYREQARP